MNKYDDVLAELRTQIDAEAPGIDREERLSKVFELAGERLGEISDAAVAAQSPLAKFAAEVNASEIPEPLKKSLTDVSEFAMALRAVEDLMERLQLISEGKRAFPSVTMDGELDEADRAAQTEHADALLAIIVPFYTVGLRALQQMTGAEVADAAEDASDALPGGAQDQALKADLAVLYSGLANEEVDPQAVFATLAKQDASSAPAAGVSGAAGTGDQDDDTDDDTDDDSELDPLETIKRFAAAIMLQIDAVQNSDGGDDQGATDDAATGAGAATAQKVDGADKMTNADLIANAVREAVAPMLEKIADLGDRNQKLADQLDKVARTPAETGKGALVGDDMKKTGEDVEADVQRLAKLSPDERSLELIKLAQQHGMSIGG